MYMKKKNVFIFIILISIFNNLISSCFATTVLETERVDKFVSDYINENGIPGASIVITTESDGIIYKKGFGHDSKGKSLTDNTLMRLASGSKPFTAFAILQLVEEEKIELDKPISYYLPDTIIGDSRWNKVTVRHLLCHTSGLPNPTIVSRADTLQLRVDSLKGWKLKSTPGEIYTYSNANYWVLAHLVEEISGMNFDSYLKNKIFKPLEMDNTISVTNSQDKVNGLEYGHISIYGKSFPWTELDQMLCGAGGIVTTASDMGKWLSMHLNKGRTENREILLSEELLNESYISQSHDKRYGLGWSISSSNVTPSRISHSGTLSTYESQQDIVLNKGYAVGVLLNSFTPTQKQAYEISKGIIQLMEGEEPSIIKSMPKIIDWTLGLVTIVYLAFGGYRIMYTKKWAKNHRLYSSQKLFLRLLSNIIPIILVGFLFFIAPIIKNNSSTIKDVFGIWPAAMILLISIFIVNLVLLFMRIYHIKSRN